MPPQAVIIVILIAVLVLLIRALGGGIQVNTALLIRRTLGGACIIFAFALLARGLLPLAIPLFLLGLGFLGTAGALGLNFPWSQKTPGQNSSVRTQMLAMVLDHDSGELDGEVLAGAFSGRTLSDLTPQELMALRKECLGKSDQSAALLDAYLDRMHPEWREQAEGAAGGEAVRPGSDAMSVNEAYDILGLAPGSAAAEIKKSHRRMMKRFHPDHGGSEYLARKINQARDVLLSTDA